MDPSDNAPKPESPPEETEVKPSKEVAKDEKFKAPVIVSKPQADSPKPASVPKPKSKKQTGVKNVVAVSFHPAGKIFDFDAHQLSLDLGDQVIVETDDGLGFASVVIATRQENAAELPRALKRIIRKANFEDLRQHQKNTDREKRAYQACQDKIKKYDLAMKLVHVEYLHSGSKAIFFFTSENRIDFRQLVRELAHDFHTRIEMRQIGPRDETKMMGGMGVCGRELCCSTWLRNFDPISIKMAKEQELSLNPSKLAGQCGRLKCCLSYEYETYRVSKKGLPKIGKRVCWKDGSPCGEISGHNIFTGKMTVRLEEGGEQLVSPEEVQLAKKKPEPAPTAPPQ